MCYAFTRSPSMNKSPSTRMGNTNTGCVRLATTYFDAADITVGTEPKEREYALTR